MAGHNITLTSGRKVYANHGLVSVSEDLTEVGEGYDGFIYMDDMEEPPWTPEEKMGLADMMIGRWQRFKDAARTAAGHDV